MYAGADDITAEKNTVLVHSSSSSSSQHTQPDEEVNNYPDGAGAGAAAVRTGQQDVVCS